MYKSDINKMNDIKVAFAPKFLKINPYQKQLAEHIENFGVQTKGIAHSKVFLPIELNNWQPRILHLHWLHMYFDASNYLASLYKLFKFITGLIFLKLRGVKIVWTVHNFKSHDSIYPLSDRICTWFVAHLANAIISHSATAKEVITTNLSLKKTDKVYVVPHANYIEDYENNISCKEARQALKIPDSSIVMLFFGLIRPYKGIEKMLEAFEQLQSDQKQVYLVIAGKPMDDRLLKLIKSKAENKHNIKPILQFIPNEKVQTYMNACDLVVCPYQEFLTSGALLLAMSFAKPCIAPRVGCMNEILSEAGGFLYDPDSEYGLLQAMNEAISKRTDLKHMGQHNFLSIKKQNWNSVAKKTLNIYQKCIDIKCL